MKKYQLLALVFVILFIIVGLYLHFFVKVKSPALTKNPPHIIPSTHPLAKITIYKTGPHVVLDLSFPTKK